jgi:polysaccharide export outer membrane protein
MMAFILGACSGPKNVTYLAGSSSLTEEALSSSAMIYEARIMANDVLTIAVNTTIPEAAAPFNLGSSAGSGVTITSSIQGASLQTYVVDRKGYIDYPIVGKLKVMGLTRVETQELIKNTIYPHYITESPIVNVRFKNYNVSVLGEVARPGQFIVDNEQCTILDALAMAGDLTIYGRRDNILLVREDNIGTKQVLKINLQDPKILLNPDIYYLKQNDVLYVEPNKARARDANIGNFEKYSLSIVSTLISVTTLLVTIFN